MDVKRYREDKFEIVLGVRELASRGMAAEVVEEVNAMDPHFFMQNPLLLFKFKQVSVVMLSVGLQIMGKKSGMDSHFLKYGNKHSDLDFLPAG